ncbi:hypothetical protein H4S04_006823 [Coemansia sp. S16]|nr:hypothetical protein GGI14_001103 [Coemansia sp. S680]KAJ2043315.1 hypothetical protein H4S04_006823 [Coemansia sp. S16]KAJ2058422.1 hypothetical protein GGI08_003431 [Coemansia sp. S2]KAJ2070088.1 hypothetical protein GGH13_004277 [Coemansia sp. S155-1]KAJ2347397.1 hypothetical protein GGH92_003216 [Coemansia sp. RSA 2673]
MEFKKKVGISKFKTKIHCGWISDYVFHKDVVQHESKSAIMFAFDHRDDINLNIHPVDYSLTHHRNNRAYSNAKSKVNAMIKLYENTVAGKSAREVKRQLDAKNIIHYDVQKMTGVSTFDKRSTEGKALIQAKRVVQRQKLLTQRGYSINAKRREVKIGMSRLNLHDNLGGSSVCVE